MYWLKRPLIWLSRIHRCRGFGIQSPSDYWFVRHVINEHWPYYRYTETGRGDIGLRRKLGRLYFRLANFRQPATAESDDYQDYLQAGCSKTQFGPSSELIRLTLDGGDYRQQMEAIYNKVDNQSLLIVEGIWRDWDFWREIINDPRTRVTFDLYYCGLVMFDCHRFKQNYIINF